MDQKIINNSKRVYIMKWIESEITQEVREDFKKHFLSSSDRKWYTVIITSRYCWKTMTTYCEIQPWFSNHNNIIERYKEKAKYTFAKQIYDEIYK